MRLPVSPPRRSSVCYATARWRRESRPAGRGRLADGGGERRTPRVSFRRFANAAIVCRHRHLRDLGPIPRARFKNYPRPLAAQALRPALRHAGSPEGLRYRNCEDAAGAAGTVDDRCSRGGRGGPSPDVSARPEGPRTKEDERDDEEHDEFGEPEALWQRTHHHLPRWQGVIALDRSRRTPSSGACSAR